MNFLRNKAAFFGPSSRAFLYFLLAQICFPLVFLGGRGAGYVLLLWGVLLEDSYFVRKKLDAFFWVTCQGIIA